VPEEPFPELAQERERLALARACRDEMIASLQRIDPETAADEITKQYVEMTVGDVLEDLRTPGAGDFFGRIVEDGRDGDTWYVGRRHIEDAQHDPVVVDWRAPIAAPFYRATGVDPLGLAHRRRFTMAEGDLSAYLDEQLDHPDAATAASGVPDPVLAEIGAARTGSMREIVATIQAEQDVVIRAPIDQCLVVQGGPGTGKTAVGLHRAAYLLFEHRRRLAREGVLVVGPNAVFLDYIANVLPSLGERSVQQRTVLDLCTPKVEITGNDDASTRRAKGDPAMLDALAVASAQHVVMPTSGTRDPFGARSISFTAHEIADWIEAALASSLPVNRRREALRTIAAREVQQRTGGDGALAQMPSLKAALTKAWPGAQPIKLVDRVLRDLGHGPSGARRRWTVADQLLVDEANSLLHGTRVTFGHVVVDEAQDHSAVALRVIGRRSPSGSMTVLGDLAQSTTPAGQADWSTALAWLSDGAGEVAHLTIGYRVPAPILDVANRLLPATGVSTVASTSVRTDGVPPRVVVVADEIATAVADEVVRLRHHDPLTGVVAPARLHDAISTALRDVGLDASHSVQGGRASDVPIFDAEAVKGLEFDAVVVVNAHEILDDGGPERGARLLYVAMTRAVQALTLVGDREPPPMLNLDARSA
jgi:DNA helicase IV